jgi:hypothetical protein
MRLLHQSRSVVTALRAHATSDGWVYSDAWPWPDKCMDMLHCCDNGIDFETASIDTASIDTATIE